jgi:hypothetical protein
VGLGGTKRDREGHRRGGESKGLTLLKITNMNIILVQDLNLSLAYQEHLPTRFSILDYPIS